jgi:universal stress protein A
MLPIKRILCPTDFTTASAQALETAAELAEHFGATLYVVHAVHPLPAGGGSARLEAFDIVGYEKELVEAARNRLRGFTSAISPIAVQLRRMVLHGSPAEKVIELAEEEKIDVIVTATHGRSGLQQLFFGSVAWKIVRHAPCPVLTIHPHH